MKFNGKRIIALALFMIFSFLTLDAVEMQGFLTADEIALFYKQGYVLKPQCLSQAEMKQLNEDITTVLIEP